MLINEILHTTKSYVDNKWANKSNKLAKMRRNSHKEKNLLYFMSEDRDLTWEQKNDCRLITSRPLKFRLYNVINSDHE